MKYKIAVIKGDGIGPEIVSQAMRVLDAVCEKFGHEVSYNEVLAGGCAYDKYGKPLPEETLKVCKESDSVLLGAVGGTKWETLPGAMRPEAALLGLRKELGLFANIRPAIIYPALRKACPLKDEIIGDGLDIVIVRELTGGLYFGERGRKMIDGEEAAFDTLTYKTSEIERIARCAFELAMKRGKKITSVEKANVLESSRLWRSVVHELGEKEYPEVQIVDLYVDNAAMQLVRAPRQFDVIVTENMFGDILSDEASQITGSIGMLPSASMGEGTFGMYEPIHGSAPDIAGTGKANPIATILSVAMMLRYSFGLQKEADLIETAVNDTLNAGVRTADIAFSDETIINTTQMADEIIKRL